MSVQGGVRAASGALLCDYPPCNLPVPPQRSNGGGGTRKRYCSRRCCNLERTRLRTLRGRNAKEMRRTVTVEHRATGARASAEGVARSATAARDLAVWTCCGKLGTTPTHVEILSVSSVDSIIRDLRRSS